MFKKVVALICVGVLFATVFCGCGEKTKSGSDFSNTMTGAGLDVSKSIATSVDEKDLDDHLTAKGDTYSVEYYKFKKADKAKSYANDRIAILVAENEERTGTEDIDTKKLRYFYFESDENLYLVSRIGDTVVLCSGKVKDRDEILKNIRELGFGAE